MQWLQESGRGDETDVIVVSDHGYSTIWDSVDAEALVREAGFPSGGVPEGMVVANNGGAVLFYTEPGHPGSAERLAAWLMEQPWCGTVTASDAAGGVPGTLPASVVGNQGPRAPELTVSFRWDSSLNGAGYGGQVYAAQGRPGTGQHGSMSRHEIANIHFDIGPSFKTPLKLDIPSGNFDLVPTILRILGISGDWGMYGRVLEEALAGGTQRQGREMDDRSPRGRTRSQRSRQRQRIKISRVGDTTYVDEGNRITAEDS